MFLVLRLPQRQRRPTSSVTRSWTLKAPRKATVGRTRTPGSSVTNSEWILSVTESSRAFCSRWRLVASPCSRDIHCGYLLCSNISPAPRLGELQGGLTSFSVARHSASLDCRYTLGRRHTSLNAQSACPAVEDTVHSKRNIYSLPKVQVWVTGFVFRCAAELTCWSMETRTWDTSRTGPPAGRTAFVLIKNVSPSNSSTSAPVPGPPTRSSALDTGWTRTHGHTRVQPFIHSECCCVNLSRLNCGTLYSRVLRSSTLFFGLIW